MSIIKRFYEISISKGKTKIDYFNGDSYEGDFKNGIKEGKGILYYKNGDKYEGEFKNDKRDGKGIFLYNTNAIYEGDFKLGFLDGTPGRVYAFSQAYWYRYLIDAKIYEKQVEEKKK